jgi:hypothetical protein
MTTRNKEVRGKRKEERIFWEIVKTLFHKLLIVLKDKSINVF